jgi:hypothetical protein
VPTSSRKTAYPLAASRWPILADPEPSISMSEVLAADADDLAAHPDTDER